MPVTSRSDAVANRTALLDAAERLLASVGHRASLEAIAREAGVGIATLYRNFADRDELVAAVTHRAFALVAEFADEAERSSAEPLEAVHTFLLRLLDHRARLVLPLLGGPGRRPGGTDPLAAAITATLTTVLGRGVDAGTIRPDATAVDVVVAGAMLSNAQLPDDPWQQVAQRHASLFVDGLRARPGNSTLSAPLSAEELDRAVSVAAPARAPVPETCPPDPRSGIGSVG